MNSKAYILGRFSSENFDHYLAKIQVRKMTFDEWLADLREKANQLEVALSNFDDDYRHFYDNYYTPYEVVSRLFNSI